MVLIAVEGYDHTGKTSMCKALANQIPDSKLIDFSHEFAKPIRKYRDWRVISEAYLATEYLFAKHRALVGVPIFHRFYPTRQVYDTYYKREHLVDIHPDELPRHVFIHMTCSLDIIKERANSVGEVVPEEAPNLINDLTSYINALPMLFSNVKVFTIDTTLWGMEQYDSWASYFAAETLPELREWSKLLETMIEIDKGLPR